MRELPTPSLFDSVSTIPVVPVDEPAREERRTDKLAKEFIRWCFSFGQDFRNSPDVINLRAWGQKTKLKLRGGEEDELLVEARRLYLKRLEHMMKKTADIQFPS